MSLRTEHNNQGSTEPKFYSNWDRSSASRTQDPRNSPRKYVLRPSQQDILRKCDYCDDWFFDIPKHHTEIHNVIGEKLVAPLGNGTVFSPFSQNNDDLLGIEKIRTGPKTPDGKRYSISPKRYDK